MTPIVTIVCLPTFRFEAAIKSEKLQTLLHDEVHATAGDTPGCCGVGFDYEELEKKLNAPEWLDAVNAELAPHGLTSKVTFYWQV